MGTEAPVFRTLPDLALIKTQLRESPAAEAQSSSSANNVLGAVTWGLPPALTTRGAYGPVGCIIGGIKS